MVADLFAFCRHYYNSALIPIAVYDAQNRLIARFPDIHFVSASKSIIPDNIFELKRNPDYLILDPYSHFGHVLHMSSGLHLFIGPVFSTSVSDSVIHNFMEKGSISFSDRELVRTYLNKIPHYTLNRFREVLLTIHYAINGEDLDSANHFDSDIESTHDRRRSDFVTQMIDVKETRTLHDTYLYELELLRFVSDGNVGSLEKLLSADASLNAGIIGDTALRQEKNIFISLTALVTRSAISGGMDIEQAYNLSDVYIRDCENSTDINYISALYYEMLVSFTRRVAESKLADGMSREIFDCVQFITQRVYEPIRVGDVAAFIGRSRSYISGKFKEELGYDISKFITRCKLEEAKNLLTFSDKSLSEISSYLCFSSQAYFQNVFKHNFGITPNQYRKRTRVF